MRKSRKQLTLGTGIVGNSGLAAILTIVLLASPSWAQLNYGRIFGGITDQSGGAILGTTVTIIDVQRGVSRTLTVDSAGQYSAPSLIPGSYTVRAEFKGFKTVERSDIVVEVGQDVRVDLGLQPGEQTETVMVTGEPPQVDTTNAQLGGTLENQTLADLPVSGRTFTALLAYTPGVIAKPGVTANAYFSNGMRSQQQVWMLDGLYDVNVYHGAAPNIGGQGGSAVQLSNFLPIDSIQELTVTENPKAEYGWKPGAQVNVGLKSGSNSIHGTAVAFGNDAGLDAKNPFLLPTQPKATTLLEQFGASIGGPIKKDKIFYFAAYEGQRYTVGFPHQILEPSTAPGLGVGNSFPDAIKDVLGKGAKLNPLSLNLAGCTAAGVCNAANGLFGNATNSVTTTFAPNSTGAVDNGVGKIDYHINQHHSVNGELYMDEGNFVSANVTPNVIQPFWMTGTTNKTAVVRGVWDWIPNSTWLNEARFGWDYANTPLLTLDCSSTPLGAPNYANLGFVSGAPSCGFPQLVITGFTNLGGTSNPQLSEFATYAISDSVSYTRGKHLFKFGAEGHFSHWYGGQNKFGKGAINFGGAQIAPVFPGATPLEDYLVGVPSSGTLLLGNPIRNLSYKEDGFFGQDDWRLTPRLTLNLGLRYEYLWPVRDRDNLFGNFDPATPSGMIQQTSGQSVYNGEKHNFEPRLGLAWDVRGKGRTVIRAGGGLAYEVVPLLLLIAGVAQLPAVPTGFKLVEPNGSVLPSPGTINTGSLGLVSSQMSWAANTPVFNSSAGALACGNGLSGNPSPCSINVIDQNYHLTWVANWTLGVQHAITNNLSMNLAYVGNHGEEQGLRDINAATPGASGLTSEQPRRTFYSQFPYMGVIQYMANFEYSNYNALQASLIQRTSRGLSFILGYTYSHALDIASDGENSSLVMDGRHPQLDYGTSGFDYRHALTIAGSYSIPGLKTPGQLLEGWQLNSGVTLMGAFPWNAVDTTDDLSGTGDLQDRWTLAGNPKDFAPGARTPLPCYGLTTSTVFTAKNGCSVGATLPAACVAAAAAEPINPSVPLSGGQVQSGTFELNRLGCYMEGSAVIVPPAQGTFGTMGKDVMRGVPFYNWDFSLFKSWKFKERLTAQFRAEFFNILNHPQYQVQGQGATTNTNNLGAPVSFGQAQSLAGSTSITGTGFPRRVQFGVKLIF